MKAMKLKLIIGLLCALFTQAQVQSHENAPKEKRIKMTNQKRVLLTFAGSTALVTSALLWHISNKASQASDTYDKASLVQDNVAAIVNNKVNGFADKVTSWFRPFFSGDAYKSTQDRDRAANPVAARNPEPVTFVNPSNRDKVTRQVNQLNIGLKLTSMSCILAGLYALKRGLYDEYLDKVVKGL